MDGIDEFGADPIKLGIDGVLFNGVCAVLADICAFGDIAVPGAVVGTIVAVVIVVSEFVDDVIVTGATTGVAVAVVIVNDEDAAVGRDVTAAIAAAAAWPIACAVGGVADEAEAAKAACKRLVLYEIRG